jgi:hypothetical protein
MINLPLGWNEPKHEAERPVLEAQLKKELGPSHRLKNQQVRLIARRYDSDEALFELSDGSIAQVHLTWRNSPEPDPLFPKALIFESLEDWFSGWVREV